MRDAVVLAIIFGAAPIALFNPYFGVLMWYWIAYFNPHRYTWGIAYNFPVALVIAIPTIAGALIFQRLNRGVLRREFLLLLALWLWFCVTTYYVTQVPDFAGHVQDATDQLLQVSKILLVTFLTMYLINTPARLKSLFYVAALSFGVRCIPGAIFGFQTGGQSRIFGPPGTFVADNNDFALAVNMSLPIIFYLALQAKSRWVRWFLWVTLLCSMICVILSYSRGGLLGMSAIFLLILAKSKKKLFGAVALGMVAVLVLTFAPPEWMSKMNKFSQGELDQSAEERLVTWGMGINLVKDHPIAGGGFGVYPDTAVFVHYQPRPLPGNHKSQGPHSIYFQMLGEQGFVGLGLFLAMIGSCLVSMFTIRRKARRNPAIAWVIPYTQMIEISFVAYLVNGASLGRAYFDYMYFFVAATVLLKILISQTEAEAEVPASELRPVEALADTVEV